MSIRAVQVKLWSRLAYGKTDSRNRHGAWHLVMPGKDYFACGEAKRPHTMYQDLEREPYPAGRVCEDCKRKRAEYLARP